MNTSHDQQHDDLGRLLTATFAGRADTVTTGPAWTGATRPRRTRTAWLAAAATAVAVLALAGGVAVLSSSPDQPAGTGDPAVCRATLPAAWQRALAAAPLRVEGHPVTVSDPLTDGRFIGSYVDAARTEHVVLIGKDGSTDALATVPAGRLTSRIDQDGTHVVISTAPALPKDSPDSPVDAISVVDVATGTTRDVLRGAPVPAGWTVAPGNSAGAVVQGGVVYFGVRPAQAADERGEIITYTIRTGKYDVLARPRGTDAVVEHDVRGVTWRTGSVRFNAAPEGLPPFYGRSDGDTIFQPVVSDGRAVAWTDRNEPYVVHWTDGFGDVRAYDVQPDGPLGALWPVAVSGRFVVLQGDTGTSHLLDATGRAFAETTDDSEQVVAEPGTLMFSTAARGAVRVPTGSLPGLAC